MPLPGGEYPISPQENLFQYRFGDTGNPNKFQNRTPPPQDELGDQQRVQRPNNPNSNHIPFLERLRALPELRPVPWRPGQELPPEKAIDSPRVQQRGAILLSTRGRVMDTPCSHCSAGFGRFSQCITLENWFQGACSTCIFTSKGNKCSLRFQTSGATDGRALRYHSSNPEMLQSFFSSKESDSTQPAKKRKKRSDAQVQLLTQTSHASPNRQVEPHTPVSPDLDTLLQAEIARGELAGYSHVDGEKRQRKQEHKVLQDYSTNTQPSPRTIIPSRDKYPQQNLSHGWTPANIQPRPQVSPPEPVNYIRPTSMQQVYQQTIQEQQPSTPALPAPMQQVYQEAAQEQWPHTPVRPNSSGESNKEPTVPIIDMMPKSQQRHIYGIVSGLQGGIDHLQKQLNSLKSSLGIDLDEESGAGR